MSRPLLLLALLALVAGGGRAQDDPAARLLARTNEARAAHDLPALAPHDGLARAAAGHARELARRGELTHDSEDPARRTVSDRVARAGAALVEVAENLALLGGGGDVAERAVDGWLGSPGHRRNLLDAAYTHVGHAVVEAGGRSWVVQVLAARPLARLSAGAAAASDGSGDVIVELRYEEPEAPLALFVDGRHAPGAAVGPGRLRTRLAAPAGPVGITVGLALDDGTARVVERFELRPGPPPELLPGAPGGAG